MFEYYETTIFSLCPTGQHAILGSVFTSLLSQNGGEGNDSLPCASFPETSGLKAKKKSLGPSASKTYLPTFFSVFLESVSFADSSVANNCNKVQSNAVDLFAIESLRHNHYHLRHQRQNRMVLTELLPLLLLHSRYCGVRPKTKKTKVTSHSTTENEETH